MADLLKNKRILLTGSAGLLGREFARRMLENGAFVILADIDRKANEELQAELGEMASNTSILELDICSEESVLAAVFKTTRSGLGLDALVNNAYPRSSTYGRKFEDVSFESVQTNLNSHLGGYFLMCQKFLPLLEAGDGGSILNMTSIYAFVPPRFDIYEGTEMTTPVEYAMVKSGVLQLTKYLSCYLRGRGVRVNCLSPGGILNGQDEKFLEKYNSHCNSKGMLDPADVSSVLVFLLSDQAKAIGGQNIIVDDGFSL